MNGEDLTAGLTQRDLLVALNVKVDSISVLQKDHEDRLRNLEQQDQRNSSIFDFVKHLSPIVVALVAILANHLW